MCLPLQHTLCVPWAVINAHTGSMPALQCLHYNRAAHNNRLCVLALKKCTAVDTVCQERLGESQEY